MKPSIHPHGILIDNSRVWSTVDLDECTSGKHNCHQLGVCSNNIGSFTCHCQRGYTGNGTFCAGIVVLRDRLVSSSFSLAAVYKAVIHKRINIGLAVSYLRKCMKTSPTLNVIVQF